jgi:hypothetical protein
MPSSLGNAALPSAHNAKSADAVNPIRRMQFNLMGIRQRCSYIGGKAPHTCIQEEVYILGGALLWYPDLGLNRIDRLLISISWTSFTEAHQQRTPRLSMLGPE